MLSYNPQLESPERLDQLTCGKSRLAMIDQLVRDLEHEIDADIHQHHLIVGPRGAGKTHLLRVVVSSRVANSPRLQEAFLPIVLPEESAVRSPADLFLRILERLAADLAAGHLEISEEEAETRARARAVCLETIRAARSMADPLQRVQRGYDGLTRVAETLDRVLMPVVENLDSLFYLGGSHGRRKRQNEHWALRSLLQESRRVLLLGSAPLLFGAVSHSEGAFYDFFRVHRLSELHNDEVLAVIRRRLEEEATYPSMDALRQRRVRSLYQRFDKDSGTIRGLLAITGGLPRFAHLIYDVLVETNVPRIQKALNAFLDDLTPYFQQRLDPRLLPEKEIDLLHALAASWGPLQPTELVERLYGARLNEVGVLLGRLEGRGFVARKGKPGGRATTWDLTEPLYRVWTHFRSGSDERQQFLLLAEFVAVMFSADELLGDRSRLVARFESSPASAPQLNRIESEIQFIDLALEQQKRRTGDSVLARNQNESETQFIDLALELPMTGMVHAAGDSGATRELEMGLRGAATAGGPNLWLQMIGKLRQLAHDQPSAPEVRHLLARGLSDTVVHASKWGFPVNLDDLLDELRRIANAWPEDSVAREQLAVGLFNSLVLFSQKGELSRSEVVLEELRVLAKAERGDSAVRKRFANGLFNSLISRLDEGEVSAGNDLLDELRELARQWPDDAAVRERLANGIYNTMCNADKERNTTWRDDLLDELRVLAGTSPDDMAVRERFAVGLLNNITYARKQNSAPRQQTLLDELRAVAGAWPDDQKVHLQLAKGLFNAVSYAAEDGDLLRSEHLLEDLRSLSSQWPDYAEMYEWRARALLNAMYRAEVEGNAPRRDELFAELHDLARAQPDDLAIKPAYARALLVLFLSDHDDFISGDHINDLRELIRTWPPAGVDQLIAFGVVVIQEAGAEGLRVMLEPLVSSGGFGVNERVRPLLLAADVLDSGEEKALAREPEEMRRVVHLILEQAADPTRSPPPGRRPPAR